VAKLKIKKRKGKKEKEKKKITAGSAGGERSSRYGYP
jgi:hypothetical protein